MPASNSDGNQDAGQDTDEPLPNQDDANAAQPGLTTENYVPWPGDSSKDSGLIPGLLLLSSLVIPFLIVLFIWILVVVTEVPGACLFGLFSWGYCALVSPERVGIWYDMTFGQHMQTWTTGFVPQSFGGCDARVEPKQASLFETDIYYTQFARTLAKDPIPSYTLKGLKGRNPYLSYQAFDMDRFRSI